MNKVLPGESLRIPAADYNAFVDAAQAYRARMLRSAAGDSPSKTQSGIVPVRNTTGEDQDAFAVLELDAVLIKPSENLSEFQYRFAFDAKKPSGDARKLVVLQEPIKAGAIGAGMVAGLSPVRINVNDANDSWAKVLANEAGHLDSGASGPARLLYKESGIGLKWGLIQFPFEGQERCFHITEATFLDEDDPENDWSGQTDLSARIFDHNAGYGERKIVLQFPKPISARGAFHIGCTTSAVCGIGLWNPDLGGNDVRVHCFAFGWPILNFNGLTVQTLNWNNRSQLSLGPHIGASLIAQCSANNVQGYPSFLGSGGTYDGNGAPTIDCALRFNCGQGVTMQGLLIELGLQWQNVYYGEGGSINGGLAIDRSDSNNVWSFFGFYNPA